MGALSGAGRRVAEGARLWRPMNARFRWIAGGVLGAAFLVGVGLALCWGPVVRARTEREARSRGLEVSIGSVRPGWGRIWLHQAKVRVPAVPAVGIEVERVEVVTGLSLGVREVVGRGGVVRVRGNLGELKRQLRAWRLEPSDRGGGGKGARLPLRWMDVAVEWDGGSEEEARVTGLSGERLRDGASTVRAEGLRIGRGGWELEIGRPEVALDAGGTFAVSRLTAESVTARVDLDGLDERRVWDGPPDATAAPATSSSALSAPRGAEKPAGGAPSSMAPAVGAAEERPSRQASVASLREMLGGLASAVASGLPAEGVVDLAAFRLEARRGQQAVRLGPGRLRVGRDARALRVSFRPGEGQGTPLEATVIVPLQAGAVVADVKGGPVSLAALGVEEGSFGLAATEEAEASANGRWTLAPAGDRIGFDGRLAIRGLTLENTAMAPQPLVGIDVGWVGKSEAALDGSSLQIESGELRIGRARVELEASIERKGEHMRGELSLGVPLAACQDLAESAPRGLAPMLTGVKLAGTFALNAAARFDTRRAGETSVDWRMVNECRVESASPELHPRRFLAAWEREVLGADRRRMTIESGPGTPTWTPLERITPHMVTAILICEDSRFYRHRGFDDEAIGNALRDNIAARRFVRGASTVSMQLAKNLYLGREKTLARKLEEAVFTVLLEQFLTKEQIMELYLNVIEFGPGIYGIGPAATHYFGTTPAHLTLGQALYLASILPNPRVQHFGPDGLVTDRWLRYLHKLMHIARKISRVTDAELEQALTETVGFQLPAASVPAEPGPGSLDEGVHAPASEGDGAAEDERGLRREGDRFPSR